MRYRVSDEKVVWRIADGEAVLLHADTSAYFGLNRVGTFLFSELISRSLGAEDLAASIRQRFPDAAADIEVDVAAFLTELQEHDLVEASPDREPKAAPAAAQPPASFDLDGRPYERPQLLPYGELEKLILSGE